MMNIGIMGGTLDPVHSGHIAIAEAVKKALALDFVLLLPAGDPPHKHSMVDKYARMEMVRLAAEGHEGIIPCDMEIERSGSTYTVDTLHALRKQYPDDTFHYIIGEDTLFVVDSWRNFPEVATLTNFACVGRPGYPDEDSLNKIDELCLKYGAQIQRILFEGPDISSSEIRRLCGLGQDFSSMVPKAVYDYIREKGLYLCRYSWEEVHEKLRELLKPERYTHTLGVAETAMELAKIHGADVQRARLAGLLHDCAKYKDRDGMADYVRKHLDDTDEEELSMKSVVHAPRGMLMARDEFGVTDPEILSSIRKHTLGDAVMCKLDLIIYIADFIEPNRKDFPGLSEARALARKDLAACAKYCAELSGTYVLAKGYKINSRTAKMIEALSQN